MKSTTELCTKLRAWSTLKTAWRTVLAAGRASTSPETQADVAAFYAHEDRNLKRIQDSLRENRFEFAPAKGIAKQRPGRQPRPIVVAPIANRVVQRAMLDVLQGVQGIRDEILCIPTSFGGIKGRAVSHAVAAAVSAIGQGVRYYARSDIKDFFRAIPRERALCILDSHVQDNRFRELLRDATKTELENLAALGSNASLFPTDLGVAQGCSLSSLVGNAVLRDFDRELNQRNITCLRYVDDFVILGHNRDSVRKAFGAAQAILMRLGLEAYDPWDKGGKAEHGYTDAGFDFLGCRIEGDRVRPSAKNRAKFLGDVILLLNSSKRSMKRPDVAYRRRRTFVPTLSKLSNILEGWGKSYAFCNDPAFFEDLDEVIDAQIQSYFRSYRNAVKSDLGTRCLLRGIHILSGPKLPSA